MNKCFFIEFSNFPPALALYTPHCEMMIKLRDNARTSLDVHTIFIANLGRASVLKVSKLFMISSTQTFLTVSQHFLKV